MDEEKICDNCKMCGLKACGNEWCPVLDRNLKERKNRKRRYLGNGKWLQVK